MTAAWTPPPRPGSAGAACAKLGSVSHLLRATARGAGAPGSAGPPEPAFSPGELAAASGGKILRLGTRPIRGAAVDSRLVAAGELFVALPGERTDGHRYLGDAVTAGAAALVVTRHLDDAALEHLGDVTVVRVKDALAALHAIAAIWRARFDPLVVGVTGSIAKTSTKEAIGVVFGRRWNTLVSEGNQNNEIGLPLTLLRLRSEHRAAVLEMGMYVGGEIATLARIGRPSIGVVTAVQGVHLARIGSLDAIEAAKGELVEALPPNGTAILNADDSRVRRMASRTAARILTYGFATDADVQAEDVESAGMDGMRFRLLLPGGLVRPVAVPTLGRLSVHNALAAAATGIAAGLSPDLIVDGLQAGWSAPHRTELVRAGGVTIVDDSYNASPGSVIAALDLLGGLPGRRIAVLGEMLELGPNSDMGHRGVGRAAAPVCQLLVTVGAGATDIARGAREAGLPADRLFEAADQEAVLELLRPRLRPGDVILVKASRGIALDRLVDRLRDELGPPTRGAER
jgi:UDP-N-acetylmuramoyl-tripeptide--D-alanyl-D-alanine ligase